MDIIVTTPRSRMADAAREAADCIAAGGGEYFRRFPLYLAPDVNIGERVYYVEDGYVRGFAIVGRVANNPRGLRCDTTGQWYPPGFYVFLPADSWKWIHPLPYRGFQGYHYVHYDDEPDERMMMQIAVPSIDHQGIIERRWGHIRIVGHWLDPRPERSRKGDGHPTEANPCEC